MTFNVTNGTLPPGLTLNDTTGNISGTPTTPGTYTLTIVVTDGDRSGTTILTLTVVDCPESSSSSSASSSSSSSVVSSSGSASCGSLSPEIAAFTTAEEYENPSEVNPLRSRIINGTNALSTDPLSVTYASCQIDSTRSTVINYANLQEYGLTPPSRPECVVSVEIHVVAEYIPGSNGSGPISEIGIFNQRNVEVANANSHDGLVATLYLAGGTTPLSKQELTFTIDATTWAKPATTGDLGFNSDPANVYIRSMNWDDQFADFSPTIELRVYSSWAVYNYN